MECVTAAIQPTDHVLQLPRELPAARFGLLPHVASRRVRRLLRGLLNLLLRLRRERLVAVLHAAHWTPLSRSGDYRTLLGGAFCPARRVPTLQVWLRVPHSGTPGRV